ncbi:MAG: hypothetical protein EBX35_05305 [Planctomycetia bacterium]|nr:hypothetical protein [Planctomycetia bacterium]
MAAVALSQVVGGGADLRTGLPRPPWAKAMPARRATATTGRADREGEGVRGRQPAHFMPES